MCCLALPGGLRCPPATLVVGEGHGDGGTAGGEGETVRYVEPANGPPSSNWGTVAPYPANERAQPVVRVGKANVHSQQSTVIELDNNLSHQSTHAFKRGDDLLSPNILGFAECNANSEIHFIIRLRNRKGEDFVAIL